jgi:hypothetical protein
MSREIDVERILDAVGRFPSDIDRAALIADLEGVTIKFKLKKEFDDTALWRSRADYWPKLEKRARDLLRILDGPDGRWIEQKLQRWFPLCEGAPRAKQPNSRDRAPSVNGLKVGLKRLERVSPRLAGQDFASFAWPDGRNSTDWLFGIYLPKIFKAHFGGDAKVSRRHDHHADSGSKSGAGKSGPADSPYIRFAIAVCRDRELTRPDGKPYTAETIADARKRMKKPESKSRRSAA